jgi:cyclophilin family peptidyl-prolyl cis-trans isomerase
MMLRSNAVLLSVAAVAGLVWQTTVAQDAANPPSAEPPQAKAAEGADAPGGEATARYNALFAQWKDILKQLRKLKSDFETTKPEETGEIEKQWRELIAQGNELLPKLRDAGNEAYREGAVVDPQLQRFLLKLTQDAAATDDYEVASDLARTMLERAEKDNAPAPKELYNTAGIAAFATNDFAAAQKYFEQAKEANTLQDKGLQFESQVEKYTKYWEAEKAIREKEAAANDLPRVRISTTAGDMVVELFENEAPDTVGNFVSLVEAGFYDGLNFHRVLPGFMAQGGDPQGNGSGGPGYRIYCETDNPNARRHFRGTLSMAHAGKDTGGSQFFICFTPQEGLDGKHTAFGRIVEGLDTLARIRRIDPDSSTPMEPTKIEKMEVIRKRDHKYLPRKVE